MKGQEKITRKQVTICSPLLPGDILNLALQVFTSIFLCVNIISSLYPRLLKLNINQIQEVLDGD